MGDVEGSKSETSRLVMVSPDGEDQVENAVFCHGPGSNFKTVTHECRYVGDNKFLSIHQQAERSSEGITAKGTTYHHFLAESVVEWDTGSNTLAELKHFDDVLSITDYPGKVLPKDISNSVTESTETCSKSGSSATILDWSHASSITFDDADELWIVSFRNLNLVMAFSLDWSELIWSLGGGSMETEFHFDTVDEAFFDVHEASVTSNTDTGEITLLAIDDGNNRPGCKAKLPQHCFSRAVEYKINSTTGTAKLSWQFEYPYLVEDGQYTEQVKYNDLWELDGGSVSKLTATDRYLVAFTGTYGESNPYLGKSYVFEVETDGSIWAMMTVPGTMWKSGSYRAVPYNAIYGESTTNPLS